MLTGKTLKSYYDRLQSIKTGATDINEYPELREDYIDEASMKTPETDAIVKAYHDQRENVGGIIEHAESLERERDEARKDAEWARDLIDESSEASGTTFSWENGLREDYIEEAAGAELTVDGKRMILQRVNGIIDFIDSEMKGSSIEFTEAYNYWIHHESADFISEDLREIVGDSFDVSSKEDLEEGVDKSSPIYKEYEELKKLPIKSLRNKLSQTHKIVDLKGYDKEGAISQVLRDKHGDKKVDAAFGFSEKRRRS